MLSLSRSGRRERLSEAPPRRLKLNFTTSDPNGLILWINMGADYFGIGVENGYIKLSWSLQCDNSSSQSTREYIPVQPKLTSSLISAGFLADGEWHSIVLTLRQNISLAIDGHIFVEEQCYHVQDYDDLDLYIGGITEENFIARRIFPTNFKGCIDKISTKSDKYLTNYSEVHSENVRSCLLFPTYETRGIK